MGPLFCHRLGNDEQPNRVRQIVKDHSNLGSKDRAKKAALLILDFLHTLKGQSLSG